MTIHGHERLIKHVRAYINVFAALLALTFVTVGASLIHLAVPLAIVVALVIAALKGSLVASFFMHLVHERKPIYAVLVLTMILLAVLLALPLLTTLDQTGVLQAR